MAKKIKYEKINPKPPLREDAAVEEAQEEALENPDLLPEVRTRMSKLLRQLKEKDGDVMMIGKLKTE